MGCFPSSRTWLWLGKQQGWKAEATRTTRSGRNLLLLFHWADGARGPHRPDFRLGVRIVREGSLGSDQPSQATSIKVRLARTTEARSGPSANAAEQPGTPVSI